VRGLEAPAERRGRRRRSTAIHLSLAPGVKARPLEGPLDDVVSFRSQDLRGPLASMLGCAENIDSGELTEVQRHLYATIMVREGRRLTTLIDNALALQGLESGRRKLDIAPVDLRSLIQRAVVAAGDDEARPIAVHLGDELPLVAADAEAILGALANFIVNARRFSPDGGAISIQAQVAGDTVRVHIKDHGIGIEADALPKLFDPYYRSNREVPRVGPGLGLGLALNHRVIEAHGGHVEASSKGSGRGALFEFTLPVLRPDAAVGDVLIVADDARFARVVKAELAAHGLSAVRADDGETAELILDGMKPRAILLDLPLPGLRGEDFQAHMQARLGTRHPLVVVTAESVGPGQISMSEMPGVMAVLPKEAGTTEAAVALIAKALAPEATVE